jgi:MerR family transcriptional regulator, thiopeptide resistance regulator
VGRQYRVGELATLAGVSIRTLHHYDRIGLVHPSAHSEGGHRLYSERDLLRLQQVLTLRYLGFSLKQIEELLDRPEFDLVGSMQIQRNVLRDRIAELEHIEAALGELVDSRLANGRWDWALVARASAAVGEGLGNRGDEMQQYFTPEQMRQFEELGSKIPPEEIRAIEEGWTTLLAEVRANRDLDPASPKARELADRWDRLHEKTASYYRDYPELWQAIGENYQKGSFEGFDQAPQAEDFAFIERVKAARK